MFGEDDCLNAVLNAGNPKPLNSNGQPTIYSVTCDSVDALILHANIDDIHKLLKNERQIISFMN